MHILYHKTSEPKTLLLLHQTHIKEWMIWFQASSSYYIGHRCEYMIIYSEGFFSLSFTTEDSGSGHLVRSATNIMSHESQEASPLKNVGPSLSWDLSPHLALSYLLFPSSSTSPPPPIPFDLKSLTWRVF